MDSENYYERSVKYNVVDEDACPRVACYMVREITA
jgi:hypothetical protein